MALPMLGLARVYRSLYMLTDGVRRGHHVTNKYNSVNLILPHYASSSSAFSFNSMVLLPFHLLVVLTISIRYIRFWSFPLRSPLFCSLFLISQQVPVSSAVGPILIWLPSDLVIPTTRSIDRRAVLTSWIKSLPTNTLPVSNPVRPR